MKLRTRLSLMFFFGILLADLAVAACVLWLQLGELRRETHARTDIIVSSVSKMAGESLLAEDPMMLTSYLSGLLRERPELAGARLLHRGEWIDVQAPVPKAVPPGGSRLVKRASAEVRLKGETSDAAVELTFSKDVLEHDVRAVFQDSVKSAALVALLVAFLGLPLSVWLSGVFMSPIDELGKAIDRVAEGETHTAIPVKRSDELGRLTARFNRMFEKLDEVESMKTAFIKAVTHDLRSPLGAIESYARQMARTGKLDDEAKKNLEHIERSAKRLHEHITQLLESARIERGMLDVSPQQVDLAGMVRDMVLFFGPRAREAGIKLAFELPEGELKTLADPERIQQVLTNLIGNALKFTEKGGKVTVYAKRKGEGFELGVMDSGIGIKPEDKERLFKRFERLETPFKTQGSGLGLSIAKTIVELHGGVIDVESEPGHGSRFFFSLPARTDA